MDSDNYGKMMREVRMRQGKYAQEPKDITPIRFLAYFGACLVVISIFIGIEALIR